MVTEIVVLDGRPDARDGAAPQRPSPKNSPRPAVVAVPPRRHRASRLLALALGLAALAVVGTSAMAEADGGWREILERMRQHRPKRGGTAPSGVTSHDDATRRTWVWGGWGRSRDPGSVYALDSVPRHRAPNESIDCSTDALTRHRGTHLRYAGAVRVHEAFVPRLETFESIARDIAIEVYGRAPRRIVHAGTYACRASRGRATRISEHALGNALDLKGFDFGPMPRGEELPEGLHRSLRRGFSVRVARHWSVRRERDSVHAEFLHRLTDTLRARPDVFRGIVGPPRRRHHDHLHLDAAPWRYAMYHHE